MKQFCRLLSFSTLLVALLPGLGIFLGDRWWSINHLRFLPGSFALTYACLSILITITLSSRFENSATAIVDFADQIVVEWRQLKSAVLLGLFAILFVTFQCQTYFLGDGYTLASIFSLGTESIQKPTEWGSTIVIWLVQLAFGEATHETAELAIQTISVLSGIICIVLFRLIAVRMGNTPAARVLIFGSLLGGGWMLLFFGYVEYYPLLWVAALSFVTASVRYLQTQRGFFLVPVFFILACLMHLQAAYLFGGFIYLIAKRAGMSPSTSGRLFWPVLTSGAVMVLCAVAWLFHHSVSYELVFLPLVSGRPNSSDYAVLTSPHLVDIAQLILLLVPTVVSLIVIRIAHGTTAKRDSVRYFLIALSIGAGFFLLLIDPVLGLGRDWDLFSFTILPPILLLLYEVRDSTFNGSKRYIVGTVLSGFVVTALFIFVSVRITSSEHRFYQLLRNYGTKERMGWTIFGTYLNNIGERQLAAGVFSEMNRRFPEYIELWKGYRLLEEGRITEADLVARKLVSHNPYEANFLVFHANVLEDMAKGDSAIILCKRAIAISSYSVPVYNKLGQLYLAAKHYDSAATVFHKGMRIGQGSTNVLEGLALSYFYRNHLDSALMISDSLITRDPDSPGAALVQLIVALKVGDTRNAQTSYLNFKNNGKQRSDYERMVKYYKFLIDSSVDQM